MKYLKSFFFAAYSILALQIFIVVINGDLLLCIESIALNLTFIFSLNLILFLSINFKIKKNQLIIKKNYFNLSFLIQNLLLIIVFILFYTINYKLDILSYFINGNMVKLRDSLLNGYFPVEIRLIGYISVISTIIYIEYEKYSNRSFIFLSYPFIISLIIGICTGGRGFFIINISIIYYYILQKNNNIKNILLFIFIVTLIFLFVEWLRNNEINIDDIKKHIEIYLSAPIYGLQYIILNMKNFSQSCILPINFEQLTSCHENLDHTAFYINIYNTYSNVYGSLGKYLISDNITEGIGLIILTLIILYNIFYNLIIGRFFGISFYLFSTFMLYYFFMNVIFFNGFILILYIIFGLIIPFLDFIFKVKFAK
ncbi:O-antigen polymerase [Polynucleobacter asymbioticus]|uniref:O-antigen polymerase n=1 Tax=Polynucleobacter asymbioticus TaxID=576611 RepID=UPI0008F7F92F|nr:O-antigen polymerase [Polynucleobacter asymbioticus]